MNGKTEELVGILQWRYGYGKTQAEIEINHWLRDLEQPTTLTGSLYGSRLAIQLEPRMPVLADGILLKQEPLTL